MRAFSLLDSVLQFVTGDRTRCATKRRGTHRSLGAIEQAEERLLLSGTPTILKEFGPGDTDFSGGGLTNANGQLVFAMENATTFNLQPWISNGTAAGTKLLKNTTVANTQFSFDGKNPVTAGAKTFFVGENPNTGVQSLWTSNGTTAGTIKLQDFGFSGPMFLTNVNGTLFFGAINDNTNKHELWKSDGTTATLVKSFNQSLLSGFDGPNFTAVGNTLFFTFDNGTQGSELWKSDGTSVGTKIVKDIRPAGSGGFNEGSEPSRLTNMNGKLFFVADNGINGIEPWVSDGTAGGTKMIKDVVPGAQSSAVPGFQWGTEVAVGNKVFYVGEVLASGNPVQVMMVTDGTAVGTKSLTAATVSELHQFNSLTNANGRLFFADNGGFPTSLWTSNGTISGTTKIKDIQLDGFGYENPLEFTAVGNTLFFVATDAQQTSGVELWKSDGTTTGTVMVTDLYPGEIGSYPEELTLVGNTLYFTAREETHGREIYKLPVGQAPAISNFGGNVTYTRGSAPITVAGSPTLTVTDSDSPNFAGGQLKFSITQNLQTGDLFTIAHEGTAAGQIGVSGNNISFAGVVIGVKSGGGATPLTINLNSSATAAAVQALIRRVRWRSTSTSTLTRTISVSLSDGDGGFSAPLTKLINIL